MGVFALLEDVGVLGNPQRAGFAQDLIEFFGAETRKQRQVGNQRMIDRGHVPPQHSVISIESKAFSSEVETGSRQENASNQESRLRLGFPIKRKFALAQQWHPD